MKRLLRGTSRDTVHSPINSKNEIRHLLVIRLSAMGDVAMTVPVLKVFRATYPEVKITVLTRRFFEPIFAGIDNLEVYHAAVETRHKGIFGLAQLAKELRGLDVDAVADLHNVIRSKILKFFFNLNGIKVVQLDKGREAKKALIRPANKVFKQLKTTHERYAEVFAVLNFPMNLEQKFIKTTIPELTPKILALTGENTCRWIGIAPFAQYKGKTYPLELMIEVIEQLQKQEKLKIFLFGGGEQESDVLNTIASKYGNVVNVAGMLLFEEELTLIANLDVMLSMDSGNAHLAAMYNIPTITLWGVTHPFAGFMPFGQPEHFAILPDLIKYDQIPTSIYGNEVPVGYEKVMYSITPEQVVSKILEVVVIS